MVLRSDDIINDSSQLNETVALSDSTSSLGRLFVRIWVVLLILNLIGGWVLVEAQLAIGIESMVRDRGRHHGAWHRSWPESPPWGQRWPDPKHSARFSGPIPFVHGHFVRSWDEDGNQYTMDVVHVDLPAMSYAAKTTSVTSFSQSNNGDSTVAVQNLKRTVRPDLAGMVIDPLIQTVILWVIVGVLPIAIRDSQRAAEQRRRERDLNCLECGYDIQDLQICPECGTPTHRVFENEFGDSAQLVDGSSR